MGFYLVRIREVIPGKRVRLGAFLFRPCRNQGLGGGFAIPPPPCAHPGGHRCEHVVDALLGSCQPCDSHGLHLNIDCTIIVPHSSQASLQKACGGCGIPPHERNTSDAFPGRDTGLTDQLAEESMQDAASDHARLNEAVLPHGTGTVATLPIILQKTLCWNYNRLRVHPV
jgi:hypothetical protein